MQQPPSSRLWMEQLTELPLIVAAADVLSAIPLSLMCRGRTWAGGVEPVSTVKQQTKHSDMHIATVVDGLMYLVWPWVLHAPRIHGYCLLLAQAGADLSCALKCVVAHHVTSCLLCLMYQS